MSKKRLKEAKNFQKEQQEKYPLSKLAVNFVSKSNKYQRRETIKFFGVFLIIPLIGTVIGGYFIVREINLNADKKLIRECEGKKSCHGRIEALERLVKAKRSLKSYNLYRADLYRAHLYRADLYHAYLNFVTLYGAKLYDADLRSADLRSANLSNANLVEAKNLTPSQIKLACYWEKAIYKGNWDKEKRKWIVDEKANKEYIDQLKKDKASEPKEPVDCSYWE